MLREISEGFKKLNSLCGQALEVQKNNNQLLLNHKRKIDDLTVDNLLMKFGSQLLKKENEELREEFGCETQKLKRQTDDLRWETQQLKSQNENLRWETQQLKNQNEALMQQKRIEQENINNFKLSFEENKKKVEKINLEKSEEYITKLIVNKFVKEFDIEEGKKNPFTISLFEHMKKFNEEYMEYCSKFIKSFKENSQKIVNEFNVKDNKILIEHINFIVIGKAGVGKSVFINESLLLPEGKRAPEDIGESVTDKSSVYESDKLKMVRMWDTQGFDYKISQEFILNEINRIVENGLKQGPDHYINIILYCTENERFQEEDAQLIYEIMKLYPLDNLPVIITQLKAYFIREAKEMEKKIELLSKYLDKSISDKIEIRDIVAREKKGNIEVFETRGIPELLKLSVDLMGRSITSATCKKFSQEIEKLCKNYVEKQINFIENQFKYEMEILEVSRSMYVEDMESLIEDSEKKQIKTLSEMNIYRNIEDRKYFEDNFINIMGTKFFDIYNHLNNDIDILNEEKEDQENIIRKNEQANQIKEENQNENNIIEENKDVYKNKDYQKNKKEDKPLVLFFIEDRIQKLKDIISNTSQKAFNKIFDKLYQDYSNDLQKEQYSLSKTYGVNCQAIDPSEIEKTFKEELFINFNNIFFKNMFCIILKLFMNNLKKILISYYQKELKENEKMQKIINKKAEDSLKNISQKLQQSLLKELNENFEDKKKKNEFDDFDANDLGF